VRVVFLGGPGSGKGTQGQLLSHKLGIPLISTGDILREAIAQNTPLGLKALPYLEKGELVPDRTLIKLIRESLLNSEVSKCWVLDGYPRTAFQAEELDFLLVELNQQLNYAIWLDVPEDVMINRSQKRLRDDDHPDIVQRRMEIFHHTTIPMMEYYQMRGCLLTINGHQSIEEIHQDICEHLKV
jgi:adenylate kinase